MLGSGDEAVKYRKAELKAFMTLGVEDQLGPSELSILGSVLEFSGKCVEDIVTPQEDVFTLSAEKIVVRCSSSSTPPLIVGR